MNDVRRDLRDPTPEHAPKTAALLALAEGRLSSAGRARIEAHLAGCEVCRRELASIHAYEAIASEIREQPTLVGSRELGAPAIDWRKIEGALEQEARAVAAKQRARRRNVAPMAALALAAAVLLGLAAWRLGGAGTEAPVADRGEARQVEVAVPTPVPDAPLLPLPEVTPIEARVVLAAGSVRVGARVAGAEAGDAELSTASAGQRLAAGSTLLVGESSEAHLLLGSGSAAIARAGTRVRLSRLASDEVELALSRGAVDGYGTSEGRYVVLAYEHRLEVQAVRFEVELDDAAVMLRLRDGRARITRPDGSSLEVAGPARWSSAGAATRGVALDADDEHALAARAPVGLGVDLEATLAPLSIAHGSIVRWELSAPGEDDSLFAVPGVGTLGALVPIGTVHVVGFDASGRELRAVVEVTSHGAMIEPDALRAEPPRTRMGYLDPEVISDVVRRGAPRLQRCYEQALRVHPDITGSLTARITVNLDGVVTRVRVQGGEAPEQLHRCVTGEAQHWQFPEPTGGPVTFDVPLRFTSVE